MVTVMVRDRNRPDDAFRFGTREVDREQAILQVGSQHLHSVGQHESSLELARRDAAVEILAGVFLPWPPARDTLGFFVGGPRALPRDSPTRPREAPPVPPPGATREPRATC